MFCRTGSFVAAFLRGKSDAGFAISISLEKLPACSSPQIPGVFTFDGPY